MLSACQKEPDPTSSVTEGLKKMIDVKKTAFELNFEGVEKKEKSLNEFAIAFSGRSDSENKENSRFDSVINLKLKLDGRQSDVALSAKMLDKNLYLSLSKAEIADVPKEALAQFTNKWWEIPVDVDEKDSYAQKFTDEQEKFLQMIRNSELFTNIQKVAEEEVKGIMCRKYQVDVSKAGLQKILEGLPDLTTGAPLTNAEKAAIGDRLKDMDFDGYVWVGKDDEAVHKISGTVRITEDSGDATSVDFSSVLWDFDKDVAVEKPAESTPFNPALLFGLAGGLMSQGGQGVP